MTDGRDALPAPFRVAVIIAPNPQRGSRAATTADMMGFALPSTEEPGRIAYVFYPRVEQAAKELGVDAAILLSHVIAHEMGHLLLGPGSHSSAGIMRDRWDDSAAKCLRTGSLTFTPDQAMAIKRNASFP